MKTASKAWKLGTNTGSKLVRSTSRSSRFVRASSVPITASIVAMWWSAAKDLFASEAATSCADWKCSPYFKSLSLIGSLLNHRQTLLFFNKLLQIQITQQSSRLDSGFWAASPSICLGVTILASWVVIAFKVVFRFITDCDQSYYKS